VPTGRKEILSVTIATATHLPDPTLSPTRSHTPDGQCPSRCLASKTNSRPGVLDEQCLEHSPESATATSILKVSDQTILSAVVPDLALEAWVAVACILRLTTRCSLGKDREVATTHKCRLERDTIPWVLALVDVEDTPEVQAWVAGRPTLSADLVTAISFELHHLDDSKKAETATMITATQNHVLYVLPTDLQSPG
jgi:hypothetical protein